jgi:hypothetical protein
VGADRSVADLFFGPNRDETGGAMTLRVVYADGSMAIGSFPGGACDPLLRAPEVDRGEVVARPGDDLNALANANGTVRLSKGKYPLNRPLVLSRPVTLQGETGVTLEFSQAEGDAPWTTAIKIHAGHTSLRDFAVRFSGRVRWNNDVSYGPAVIGTTDNLDGIPMTPKHNLSFSGLDLEGPEKSSNAEWVEAPRLMRLRGATCGKVTKNTLRGGLIHLFDGPWEVQGNLYRGTQAGTFTGAVFVVHHPHDVAIQNNRARPEEQSGKTWRFVTFVHRGQHDRVEDNVIEGLGPRDDDKIPDANAPEIILTESYSLWFEGRPAAVSADGRLLKIDRVSLAPARTGDVVSILSGKGAGEWRRIAQRIEPTLFLLETPLPKGADAVSISPGFVAESFARNTIDARRGSKAAGLVLAGNHFGSRVTNNRILGAGDSMQVMAYASETPNIWGWSHAPLLGVSIEGNTLEDSERGATIGTLHSAYCKSNKGRTYMTLLLKGNTVIWSDGFLSKFAKAGQKHPAAGITLGYVPSLDPGESLIEEQGNRLAAPPRFAKTAALRVHAATLNGKSTTNRSLPLEPRREPTSSSASGSRPPAESPRR